MIINKINFPIYGTLIMLSIIAGIIYNVINLKKEKLNKEYILYYALLFVTCCLLGTIVINKLVDNNWGLSSYYGLISVIGCALIFNKIVPKDNIYLKYAIISLPLIYSIGKIGCFFAGCCYGIEYDHILSVTYTFGLNTPLFPIQALEAIIFFILFLILNHFKNKKNINEITIIVCATFKLLLDFLRYEHMSKLITKNQIISLILIVIATIMITKKNLK